MTTIISKFMWCWFFFFQAEDGIRDLTVTGVQTCALPIFEHPLGETSLLEDLHEADGEHRRVRGRLEHDGVAEDERGHDLPRRDREREVPGRDRKSVV